MGEPVPMVTLYHEHQESCMNSEGIHTFPWFCSFMVVFSFTTSPNYQRTTVGIKVNIKWTNHNLQCRKGTGLNQHLCMSFCYTVQILDQNLNIKDINWKGTCSNKSSNEKIIIIYYVFEEYRKIQTYITNFLA